MQLQLQRLLQWHACMRTCKNPGSEIDAKLLKRATQK